MPNIWYRRQPVFRSCLFNLAAFGILIAYHMISPLPAAGQIGINDSQPDNVIRNPNIPWQLEADEIMYDQEYDAYIARGNVVIHKANIRLLANFVRFDQKNMKAYAEGDVVLTNGLDILSGTSMEMDLEDQVGSVEDGYLYLKENNYHLTGRLIKKVGEKSYFIDDATLTTCDGENPDWKITGKNVNVTAEGGGTAQHATLWARKMPLLYTPYFYYPARKKRQTGLLWPEGGHSDKWGWFYNQPFFWAIDKSSDATFYAHYMAERGIKGGLEYRYYLDDWSKGTWQLDGFNDSKTDEGGQSSEDWGFEDGSRVILRKNSTRYWLRGSHHQRLPYGFQAMLDIDLVSDQDYTREFQGGYMGWSQSRSYFEEVFHRNLDDYNDPIRTNQLNFNRLWSQYSLNAQLRYDLDSNIRNSHTPDTTLQQLPVIEFDAIKQRIATSPFFYNLDSQYIYYWSVDGRRTQRVDAYPRFYLPFRLKNFLAIEPSIGARGTAWRLDKKEFGPEDDRQYYTRGLYDTRLDLFSEIFRVFRVEGETLEAVKHTVRPRVIHQYIPDIDQTKLPNFDAIDRIENQNLITYSLTNTLTSKTRKEGSFEISRVVDKDDSAVIDSPTQYNYNDFFRFELEQSYDINEAMEANPEKPFSPLGARLDVFPGKYIALDATALWSVYDYKFLSHNLGTNLWDGRGDKLSVEYRYTRDSDEIDLNEAHSIFTDLEVKVTDRLRVSTLYEYNFLDNTRVQLGFGINYRANCWAFEGRVLDKTNVDNTSNLSYEFKIELFGLGEFGI
ncbi:MAG: LPS-assembly protein LptD [Desulfobacterales bacterium]|nr:MAG: LPS-assembly protein LptD [Desulfobacterales bacterium]